MTDITLPSVAQQRINALQMAVDKTSLTEIEKKSCVDIISGLQTKFESAVCTSILEQHGFKPSPATGVILILDSYTALPEKIMKAAFPEAGDKYAVYGKDLEAIMAHAKTLNTQNAVEKAKAAVMGITPLMTPALEKTSQVAMGKS